MIKKILIISFAILSVCKLFGQQYSEIEAYFYAFSKYQNNEPEKALQYLNNYPEHPEFIEFKANIYYNQKQYTQAIQSNKKLIKSKPAKAYYNLAVIYAEMGYEIEAIHYLDLHFNQNDKVTMREINTQDAFLAINRTREWREFWNTQRYSKAEQDIQEALYLINQNRTFEAIDLLSQIQRRSKKHKVNYLKAKAYYNINDLNNSLRHVDRAIELNNKIPEYFELRLEIFQKTKKDAEALKDIEKLIELDSFNHNYILTKAKIQNNNELYDEAKNTIEFYLRFFPENEEALYYSATILSNNNLLKDAIIMYNNLIEINPSKAEYYIDRGDIFFYFDDWSYALKDYSMALDIDPNQGEVYYKLGWCRYKLNDKAKACRAWFHAKKLNYNKAPATKYKLCRDN